MTLDHDDLIDLAAGRGIAGDSIRHPLRVGSVTTVVLQDAVAIAELLRELLFLGGLGNGSAVGESGCARGQGTGQGEERSARHSGVTIDGNGRKCFEA